MKNILAIAASNSTNSINKQLATWVAQQIAGQSKASSNIKTLDLNDFEMPIYSGERERSNGIPQEAHAFLHHIKESDIIVLSLAEHNGSYTAAYKNIYDWASRIEQKVWNNKPIFLTSTSPGPRGGATILNTAANNLPHQGGQLFGNVALGSFYDNFDAQSGPIDKKTHQEFLTEIETISKI